MMNYKIKQSLRQCLLCAQFDSPCGVKFSLISQEKVLLIFAFFVFEINFHSLSILCFFSGGQEKRSKKKFEI